MPGITGVIMADIRCTKSQGTSLFKQLTPLFGTACKNAPHTYTHTIRVGPLAHQCLQCGLQNLYVSEKYKFKFFFIFVWFDGVRQSEHARPRKIYDWALMIYWRLFLCYCEQWKFIFGMSKDMWLGFTLRTQVISCAQCQSKICSLSKKLIIYCSPCLKTLNPNGSIGSK